jgi:hypothetical protein
MNINTKTFGLTIHKAINLWDYYINWKIMISPEAVPIVETQLFPAKVFTLNGNTYLQVRIPSITYSGQPLYLHVKAYETTTQQEYLMHSIYLGNHLQDNVNNPLLIFCYPDNFYVQTPSPFVTNNIMNVLNLYYKNKTNYE